MTLDHPPALRALLARAGIDPAWTAIDGTRHDVAPDSLLALLDAMGLDGRRPAESLAALDAAEPRWLSPFAAGFVDDPVALALRVPADAGWRRLRLVARLSDGVECVALIDPDALAPQGAPASDGWRRVALPWPFEALPGEHAVVVEGEGVQAEGRLLLAPAACHAPPQGSRGAGLAVQTYALRDRRDTPIGDLESLARVAEWFGGHGGDVVLANPLAGPIDPRASTLSPYSPSSRLTIDPVYLPGPSAAGAVGAGARIGDTGAIRAAAIARLAHEYDALLRGADGPALDAFHRWCVAESDWLDAHAAFALLVRRAIREGWPGVGWDAWPADCRDPRSAVVRRMLADESEAIDRGRHAIWRLERAAVEADRRARASGLGLGVGHDLPLGCARHGAETWSQPGAFALDASVGAPPDPFSATGQDWGLPPLVPAALVQGDSAAWRRPLRMAMRRGGLVRIDHVMGLDRLWWIPAGGRPQDGAYVRYPMDRLLPILVHDSHVHRCVVVGEDLGTVEPGLRERLARRGVLSTRVLRFERGHDGRFLPPERFPARAWVTLGTHDLPATIGHRHGTDLGPATPEDARTGRDAEIAALEAALQAAGIAPEPAGDDRAWLAALHRYIAATPAVLVGVQAEDLDAHAGQVNVPGTVGDWNWSHRLASAIEDWDGLPTVRAVLDALSARLARKAIDGSGGG